MSTAVSSRLRQALAINALLLACSVPAGAATVLDEEFDAWPDGDWSWSATTGKGATWSTPQSSGSALTLQASAGTAGYDRGTLVHTAGIATGADGVAGNAAGEVTVSYKFKWTAGSMRMYPQIELANGPTSDDFMRFSFLASDAGGSDGRMTTGMNGVLSETNYNPPTEFVQQDTYGYVRFWIDVDQRLARWFVSGDGVNWTQKRQANLSGASADPFFSGLTTLHPRVIMEIKDDVAGDADRTVTIDRIWAEATVPEPAGAGLLLTLIGGMLGLRRRRMN